ncbi:MAG TPA: sigma-70 family RNA polymerase sigma factor [Chthoniobacterales bacterium]|jgi:RNA polymerase sigma-70 factor (ECF subfamily)|nr:sigma-70 family RNA polymerase sigma factor [Chthoniobacterales bacterium]
MAAAADKPDAFAPSGFNTTHWSLISRATTPSPEGRAALESLCRAYWFPVYAFARKQGCSPTDAEDITQDFFAEIVQSEFLERADPQRGRFRSYLLTAVRRRIINARDSARAQKRGGGSTVVSINEPNAEKMFLEIDDPGLDPSQTYERGWALTVLQRARQRLRDEQTKIGRLSEFELLEPYLSAPPGEGEYATLASTLNIARNNVAVAVHRLGKSYRKLVHEEIADTVDDPAEVGDELNYLLKVLSV